MKEFTAVFGRRQLADLREDKLREFYLKSEFAPKTKRNRRAKASQLFNFALKKDWVRKNTVLKLEGPRLPDKEPVFLSVDNVRGLLVEAE